MSWPVIAKLTAAIRPSPTSSIASMPKESSPSSPQRSVHFCIVILATESVVSREDSDDSLPLLRPLRALVETLDEIGPHALPVRQDHSEGITYIQMSWACFAVRPGITMSFPRFPFVI